MNELILYTTDDGRSQIKLRSKDHTVWLSQREMAELFDVSPDNVGLHLKNIFEDGELSLEATTEESSVVQKEGGREVSGLHGIEIGPGFQPSGPCAIRMPGAVPQAGMASSLWPSNPCAFSPQIRQAPCPQTCPIFRANGAFPYQPGAAPQVWRHKSYEG